MSDSNNSHTPTGFSTGALEKGDYSAALDWLNQDTDTDAVEISALRFDELEPTVRNLERLKLDRFRYVSFHAPSSFRPEQEESVLEWLKPVFERGWNIVVHPDVIYTPGRWQFLGRQLLIENMDRRKPVGRTVDELKRFFGLLPDARFCLDVAHARQIDTTLTLLFQLFEGLCDRIAEIHISELDSRCRHIQMSGRAVRDYQCLPWGTLHDVPVIIESMLDHEDGEARLQELNLARNSIVHGVNRNWRSSRETCASFLLSDGSPHRIDTNSLSRERAVLRRMLADTPEEELIERRSLNSRIDAIDEELQEMMHENQGADRYQTGASAK